MCVCERGFLTGKAEVKRTKTRSERRGELFANGEGRSGKRLMAETESEKGGSIYDVRTPQWPKGPFIKHIHMEGGG